MKLGRVAGIDVFLHWTFVFAPLALVVQSWYAENSIAMTGILLVLLCSVFGCVLLHEFGHAFAARYFGVKTKDIILTPIGGLARLVGMPKKPLHEFAITLAGPLVNVTISGLLAIYLGTIGPGFRLTSNLSVGDLPTFLFYINLFLFGFNLIPAFPMDGGRILRSILAIGMSFSQATLIAGSIGQILAVAFAVYGLTVGYYPACIIGVFVFFAAKAEIQLSRNEPE